MFGRRVCAARFPSTSLARCPTAKEASEFLEDKDPKKRSALIDRLLERDEFADYWSMKWGDLLRIRAEFPINLWPNAAQAYHRWVHDCLRENMPYDKFVREMLTSNGSNFRVGQVNFYRAVQSKDQETIAKAVALTFMGTRAEKWPKEQLAGMAQFFSKIAFKQTGEWKEEIIFFDPAKTATLATNSLEQGNHGAGGGCREERKQEEERKLEASQTDGSLPGRHASQDRRGPRSAGGLCRLADYGEESLVCTQHRQSRLVVVHGAGHHS